MKQPSDDSFVMLGSLTSELQREVTIGEEGEFIFSVYFWKVLLVLESERLSLGGTSDLDDKLRSLARMFEIASEEGGVDHPLCVDCASQVKTQMENEKRKVEAEIADYSEAIKKLENEQNDLIWFSDGELESQLKKVSKFERNTYKSI